MDNIIENSLNFWQQRLVQSPTDQSALLLIQKQKSIVDRVVIKSANYWKKVADQFLAKSSTNKSIEESHSSQTLLNKTSDC